MSKIIKINSCFHCPDYEVVGMESYCCYEDRFFTRLNEERFPEFCPLEDYANNYRDKESQ